MDQYGTANGASGAPRAALNDPEPTFGSSRRVAGIGRKPAVEGIHSSHARHARLSHVSLRYTYGQHDAKLAP